MRRFIWLLLASSSVATYAIAQDDGGEVSSLASVRGILRAVGEDSGAVVQLSRETLDLILFTPTIVTTSKIASILPESALRWRIAEDVRAGLGSTTITSPPTLLWSAAIENVVGDSIEWLGDMVAHGRWTVIRPAEDEYSLNTAGAAPMQARMAVPLGLGLPVEARLGIETDSVQEDHFVFSTELGTSDLEPKWLAWSTRIDYRSSMEAPRSARAEQRVGVKFGGKDTIGVSGRIEDGNLDLAESPLSELTPAGELFWSHRWLPSLESMLKMQQMLPDLHSIWLGEAGASGVQMEANVRASLNAATKIDLRGIAAEGRSRFGIGLQFEFLLGAPTPRSPQRITLPDGEGGSTESKAVCM